MNESNSEPNSGLSRIDTSFRRTVVTPNMPKLMLKRNTTHYQDFAISKITLYPDLICLLVKSLLILLGFGQ